MSTRLIVAITHLKRRALIQNIDFIMDPPLYNRHNTIFTCVDQFTNYCGPIPCFIEERALCASLVAKLFSNNIARFFGVPAEVTLDRGLTGNKLNLRLSFL